MKENADDVLLPPTPPQPTPILITEYWNSFFAAALGPSEVVLHRLLSICLYRFCATKLGKYFQ